MKSVNKKIKEEVATGTGASFQAGPGEQSGSKYAWVGGRKDKRKKKRLKEEISYTPEKKEQFYSESNQKLKGYQENLKKYLNVISGITLEDFLTDEAKIEKIIDTGKKMSEVFNKIHNKLEDMYDDEDEKFYDLANEYYILYNDSDDAAQLIQDIEYKTDDHRDENDKLIKKIFNT